MNNNEAYEKIKRIYGGKYDVGKPVMYNNAVYCMLKTRPLPDVGGWCWAKCDAQGNVTPEPPMLSDSKALNYLMAAYFPDKESGRGQLWQSPCGITVSSVCIGVSVKMAARKGTRGSGPEEVKGEAVLPTKAMQPPEKRL